MAASKLHPLTGLPHPPEHPPLTLYLSLPIFPLPEVPAIVPDKRGQCRSGLQDAYSRAAVVLQVPVLAQSTLCREEHALWHVCDSARQAKVACIG